MCMFTTLVEACGPVKMHIHVMQASWQSDRSWGRSHICFVGFCKPDVALDTSRKHWSWKMRALRLTTASPWVIKISLLYGLLNRGEAYLISTWLMREQRLAQVKINQSTASPTTCAVLVKRSWNLWKTWAAATAMLTRMAAAEDWLPMLLMQYTQVHYNQRLSVLWHKLQTHCPLPKWVNRLLLGGTVPCGSKITCWDAINSQNAVQHCMRENVSYPSQCSSL